jgi:hypothetical protein
MVRLVEVVLEPGKRAWGSAQLQGSRTVLTATGTHFDMSSTVCLRSPSHHSPDGSSPHFPKRSPPRLLTAAAWGDLMPAPAGRHQEAIHSHPRYSYGIVHEESMPRGKRMYAFYLIYSTVSSTLRSSLCLMNNAPSAWRAQARTGFAGGASGGVKLRGICFFQLFPRHSGGEDHPAVVHIQRA